MSSVVLGFTSGWWLQASFVGYVLWFGYDGTLDNGCYIITNLGIFPFQEKKNNISCGCVCMYCHCVYICCVHACTSIVMKCLLFIKAIKTSVTSATSAMEKKVKLSADWNYNSEGLPAKLLDLKSNREVSIDNRAIICTIGLLNDTDRGYAVAQLVQTLLYKPEGSGFDFRWWHNLSGRTMALGLTQSLTQMSTSNISWGR